MPVSQMFVKRFFTKYKPSKTDPGQLVGTDYVEYGPLGGLDRTLNSCAVHLLIEKLQPLEDSQNPAVVMAHERADFIRRAYEAWKAGQEAPVNGTALSAWNALNAEQVEVMVRVGIKTVEEVAALTDSSASRLGLPNRNELIRQAKNFIDAKEQSRLAAKLSEKDFMLDSMQAEQEETKSQIADLQRQLAEFMARDAAPASDEDSEVDDSAPAPARRGPGRPPKSLQQSAA